jgi:secreted trypsin-like serine protease
MPIIPPRHALSSALRHAQRLATFSLTALSLTACAGADSETTADARDKVIGGAAESNEPATLLLEQGAYATCTATLIAPRVALTAAHCVYYDGYHVPDTASIVLNGRKTATAAVVDYAMHARWTGDLNAGDDIALLYLSAALPTTPIMIDRVGAAQRVGQVGKIVGFGLTTSTNPYSGGSKNSVSLQVVGVAGANSNLLQLRSPDSTYRASCRGDSGGPFFIGEGAQRVVSGVTSFGFGSETDPCQADSYYVSTAHHATWINENLNGRTTGVREVGSAPSANTMNSAGGAWGNSGNSAGGAWGDSAGGAWGDSAGGAWGDSELSCPDMFACFDSCVDTTCVEQCYASSSVVAQLQFDDIARCNELMGCEWDGDCLWAYCGGELNACR